VIWAAFVVGSQLDVVGKTPVERTARRAVEPMVR
jgi:hypothetical protein